MINSQGDDGASNAVQNVDNLPQHYTTSQVRIPRLDRGSKVLWNVGILPHYKPED
jgi:hypothetical protein